MRDRKPLALESSTVIPGKSMSSLNLTLFLLGVLSFSPRGLWVLLSSSKSLLSPVVVYAQWME